MTDLTYNIVEMTLTGFLDGYRVNDRAYSGGRAGSKTSGVVNPILANNPFLTGVKLSKLNPGGTLPLGACELRTHEKHPNWIRLNPIAGTNLKGRSGFAIHGRGPRGSDGCIVPHDFNSVVKIHTLVQARERAHRPPPTLEVVAIGDIDMIEKRMQDWSHTA